LATRQEIATVLGFRSWADLATADQMMGSAANVRAFLSKSTKPAARAPAASMSWFSRLPASASQN
jgi:thimet oligopeptidase